MTYSIWKKNRFGNPMKQDIISKIYKHGNKLGLNKKEINIIINKQEFAQEQTLFSSGPPFYPGNRYGTISIHDF